MDGMGQSIYALQVGVQALVDVLTRFGAGGPSTGFNTVAKFLQIASCADAMGKSAGAIISGCFSPSDLLQVFGSAGLLLAPVVAFGGLVAFFHSEWNALVDQFNGHDKYSVLITRTSATAVAAPCTASALAAGAHLNLETQRIDAYYCANGEAIFELDLYAIEGDQANVYLQSSGTNWTMVQGPGTSTAFSSLPASFNALGAGYAAAESQTEAAAQAAYNSDLAVVQGYTDNGAFPSGTYSDCNISGYSAGSLPDFYGDPAGYHVILGCGPTGDNSYAFFFQGTRFMGTDTAQPSQNITMKTRTATTVTIAYQIYNPGDPAAAPTGGTVDVVFQLSGAQVVPESPIPPAESYTGSGTPGR
jgi:hypothetical protein